MLYRQKKDVLIRKTEHGAYILSKENYSEKIVNESGSVFLCALSKDPQSIETLADTILKSFVGADKETIISDAIEFYETFVKEGFVAKARQKQSLTRKMRAEFIILIVEYMMEEIKYTFLFLAWTCNIRDFTPYFLII